MKLGVIGSGKIVPEALTAIKEAGGIDVNAIYARPHSASRGKELAEQFGIEGVYTDYEMLLAKADIDTVYIALVNTAHYEYARIALEHDKHVLLEKPFTTTSEEAEELFRIAKSRGLFLFEAITAVHNPVFEKMRELLPQIGRLRMMHANFSQYSSRYEQYLNGEVAPAFDPMHMGGSLYDLNVYNIHIAAALFGVPHTAEYYPNRGHNDVDTSGVLVMDYGDFKAVCIAAKDSDSPCYISVQGEDGYMHVDAKSNDPSNLTLAIRGNYDELRCFESEACHRMTNEFRDFAEMIEKRDFEKASYFEKETLDVMNILNQTFSLQV